MKRKYQLATSWAAVEGQLKWERRSPQPGLDAEMRARVSRGDGVNELKNYLH